jgi:tripartite-type tricarboxylate transporter receptor subunit TctC
MADVIFPARRRLLAAALLAPAVRAQPAYPDRPITLIVPFAPGGIADLSARAVGDEMAHRLGQSIVVDNRPSAGSIVASTAVARARPDGYTLLLMSNGNAVSAGLFKTLPYDTLKAFTPVSTLGFFDLGLFVAADSRFKSLSDVLAFARTHPGRLNIGSIAVGSTQQLAARLFTTVAGIDALIVPYRGTPAVFTALRAGEVDLSFEISAAMVSQVKAGVVRALAVTSSQRNPALPQVPTVRQAGVAGYDVASWNAVAAPAGTPPAVVERLNRAVHDAVAQPGVRDKLAALGVRLQAGTPAELQALLVSEMQRWSAVMRAAGITPQ